MNAFFFDMHTHRAVEQPQVVAIANRYWGQEEDKARYGKWQSAGVHPWYLEGFSETETGKWLEQQVALPEVIAVGECGLDKLTRADMSVQMRAFRTCLRVAADSQKPLIIHCVRAFEEVLQVLKHTFGSQLPVPVIFHGFNKKPELAQQLLQAGCCLSFGAALTERRPHVEAALQRTPADRLFLETDTADVSIQKIYTAAAALKNMKTEVLCKILWDNALKMFPQTGQIHD